MIIEINTQDEYKVYDLEVDTIPNKYMQYTLSMDDKVSIIENDIVDDTSYFSTLTVEELIDIYDTYNELDDTEKLKVKYLLEYMSNISSIEEALDSLDDVIVYTDTTIKDILRSDIENTLPKEHHNLLIYIDYDMLERDMGTDYTAIDNNVFYESV